MSRSRKKRPHVKQGSGSKWKRKAKKFANKAVTRYDAPIPPGGFYKKLFNSWDICDWNFYIPNYKDFEKPWKIKGK
jgi:hypothetical protein